MLAKKKKKISKSYVNILPPPKDSLPLEQKVILQNPKSRVFFLKSMTKESLHHLILRLVAEKYHLTEKDNIEILSCKPELKNQRCLLHIDNPLKDRRSSDEGFSCGGRIQKTHRLFEVPLLIVLRRFYAIQALKSKSEGKHPWFIDSNQTSLEDSLKGFKSLVAKYACVKEKVVFKNYSSSLNPSNKLRPFESYRPVPLVIDDFGPSSRR